MGHQFLARAGFALDQDAGGCLRHGLDPRQHPPERRALADDAPEVHRYLHLFAEIVALPLQFLAQAGVFLERRPQAVLGLVLRGHVLHRHAHPPDPAVGAPVDPRGHQRLDDVARPGHVVARRVVEIALGDDVDHLLAVEHAVGGQEFGDVPAQHFPAPIAHLGQPPVAGMNDAPLAVDGVHHRGRFPVQLQVLRLDPRCLVHLGIDHDGPAAAVDGHVGQAVDLLSGTGVQVHRHVVQPPGTAQQREVVVFDAVGDGGT